MQILFHIAVEDTTWEKIITSHPTLKETRVFMEIMYNINFKIILRKGTGKFRKRKQSYSSQLGEVQQ